MPSPFYSLFRLQTVRKRANLWLWRSDTREVAEGTANSLESLISETTKSDQVTAVGGVQRWTQYKLVFKRALATNDRKSDIQFGPGKLIPISFFAWDGSSGEHGSNFSMSWRYYVLFRTAHACEDNFALP